jgi:hypothetical protein
VIQKGFFDFFENQPPINKAVRLVYTHKSVNLDGNIKKPFQTFWKGFLFYFVTDPRSTYSGGRTVD